MGNEFGNKIKKKRIHLELSLRKVCESVCNEDGKPISVSYLNDIEQGYRKPPTGKIVIQLATTLKIDPQELLNLAGKADPIIEDMASKDAKVGVLFRKIAEHFERDPSIIDRLNDGLNKENEKKK
ncbi:MAG: helix-turn-helix transcriptional regulator [Candidatus Omnitrophica bacterium]|nr:helix-turn-helix transcriptional regulator [Candidatus Omnitrophota bacterium]